MDKDMRLFAFWRCLDFPYLEGSEVEKVEPAADPSCRLPAFIVPIQDGQRIASELDTLRQVYKIALHKLEDKWLAQVQAIVPAAILRLDHQAPEPAPEHVPTWKWPPGLYVEGTRIEVTGGNHAGKRGTTVKPGYSDPMALLDDGAVVEFHRPEELRLVAAHEEPEGAPSIKDLELHSLLRLVQAGIVAKGPDDAGVVSFHITPAGDGLLKALLNADDLGTGVTISPEGNPAAASGELDIKFVPKAEPQPDVPIPTTSPAEVPIPTATPVEPLTLDETLAALGEREKDVLLLCRKRRSIKSMAKQLRWSAGIIYRVKNKLVRSDLVTDSGARDLNTAHMWCLTDAGLAVVKELLKERNPK
jgi:hypothetical protein